MIVLLIALNIVAGLFLIAVVLLQSGKGADMGAAFGGASSTVFGASGAGNLLTKLTAGSAAVFMGTSLFLAVVSTRQHSVFDDLDEPAAAVAPAADPSAATGNAATPPAEGGPAASDVVGETSPPAGAMQDLGANAPAADAPAVDVAGGGAAANPTGAAAANPTAPGEDTLERKDTGAAVANPTAPGEDKIHGEAQAPTGGAAQQPTGNAVQAPAGGAAVAPTGDTPQAPAGATPPNPAAGGAVANPAGAPPANAPASPPANAPAAP